MMNIFALSGSLRAASNNTALLRAVARLAPPEMTVELFRELGEVPPFNPDIEATDPPIIARLRAQLVAADAVMIASPEYAHGVTGVLKNALDWMVGCEAFVNKPVVLLNAAPRAVHAHAALKEIINVMSAHLLEGASINVPLLGAGLDTDGIVAHPEISSALRAALQVMRAEVLRLKSKS